MKQKTSFDDSKSLTLSKKGGLLLVASICSIFMAGCNGGSSSSSSGGGGGGSSTGTAASLSFVLPDNVLSSPDKASSAYLLVSNPTNSQISGVSYSLTNQLGSGSRIKLGSNNCGTIESNSSCPLSVLVESGLVAGSFGIQASNAGGTTSQLNLMGVEQVVYNQNSGANGIELSYYPVVLSSGSGVIVTGVVSSSNVVGVNNVVLTDNNGVALANQQVLSGNLGAGKGVLSRGDVFSIEVPLSSINSPQTIKVKTETVSSSGQVSNVQLGSSGTTLTTVLNQAIVNQLPGFINLTSANSSQSVVLYNTGDVSASNVQVSSSGSNIVVESVVLPSGTGKSLKLASYTSLESGEVGSLVVSMQNSNSGMIMAGGLTTTYNNGQSVVSNTTVVDQNQPVIPVPPGPNPQGMIMPKISSAGTNICALQNGFAYCWGNNGYGQLGNGTATDSNVPVQVLIGTGGSAIPAGSTINQIYTGNGYLDAASCAIASNGLAYCWGNNGYGQLGNGTYDNSNVPVQVLIGTGGSEIPAGSTILQIATAGKNTCAIASNGLAYCWGSNEEGQLGNGTTDDSNVPVQVLVGTGGSEIPADTTFKQIIPQSGDFTCAIASNGLAYCWGYNGNGALGNGTNDSSNVPVQVLVGTGGSAIPVDSTFSYLSVSSEDVEDTACAIASNGLAYCWGENDWGQLGNGTTGDDSNVPVQVLVGTGGSAIPTGTTFNSISAGGAYTCAVSNQNVAYCWGYNGYGQLGNGTTNNSTVPIAVSGDHTFSWVAAGGTDDEGSYTTCGITTTGIWLCWGDNQYGQLGTGVTGGQSTIPVAVVMP